MNSKPKIVVLRLREIVYTLMLLFLVAALVVCLVLMFSGKTEKNSGSNSRVTTEGTYRPGVYTSPVTLGDSAADVEVAVEKNQIRSIRLVHLSEATAAAFPLVSPSLDHIAEQILEKQTLEGITCPQENRYTSQLLLGAVKDALALAQAETG